MTATLFSLTFVLAAPFWALMIFAPKWSWTKRIAESYLIILPVVAIYVLLMIPVLPELLPLVTRPELPALAQFMSTEVGATLVWAHMIAWDLFVGRWMYLEGRRLNVHPLVMAPVLVITILLAPVGLPLFLIVRKVCDATNRGAAVVTHQ
ncbi:ABA4-like family protein [Lentzea aerocolonigenes]|uniref:ABA4-like family protein n=1 Tax=Lentzea aerocolonigenes TaxID=68170 RepID=UPI0005EC7212|nr:ABA4-like family protein [Lentzea aerocolonigenes]